MSVTITWADIEGFKKFSTVIKNMDKNVQKAAVRALNRAGDSAKGQVRKSLAKQTGLKQKLLQKALKTKKANADRLSYEIFSEGGNISLKYLSPRETRKGVSAAPFSTRKVFSRSFIFGGRFPNRHGLVRHGHVLVRNSKNQSFLTIVKSGVVIPNEMVKSESSAAFKRAVREVLPKRLQHELSFIGL